MRIIVPTEGYRPSQPARLENANIIDNVQQFVLDFIGNLTRKKGDDGDVSAAFSLSRLPLAPAVFRLHWASFCFLSHDGKIASGEIQARHTRHTTNPI